ncbi:MAG: glycosyltransferase family 4 protein [Acidobacteria bacterium]|nr:glycosyltransferase family 4 protein [Acidobacteriota bacterium]
MTPTLRVGLDGRAFDSPAAGVRRYVRELTRALLALGEPLTLVALGGNAASCAGLEYVAEPWHPPTNLGWSMVGVMRAARRAALNVYHAPAYTAPPVGIRRMVITLHDVSYERRPEWYPHRRDHLRRSFYRASAKAADLVITDSEFSRQEIVAAYGIPDHQIRVIPLGATSGFAPADGTVPPDCPDPPFVLHVGDLHTRRNLEVALDAVLRLRARGGPCRDLTLVLAGLDRGLLPVLQRRAADAGQPVALKMMGHVDEATLLGLYQSALALVYPSRYEGFGLPMVEAMASGAPVLAADVSTSHEVIADAGLRLPVGDSVAWANAIEALVIAPEKRAEFRERGLRRAQAFTWRRTAEATYAVYRECAE